MSAHLFVSYSHKDHPFVGRLIDSLQGEGYPVWFDRGELEIGNKWRGEIVSALKACEAFILVLSPSAVCSDEIRKELSLAEDFKKPIFPIILEDTEVSDALAYQLAGLQYMKFNDEDYPEAFQRLVRGLKCQNIQPVIACDTAQRGAPFYGRQRQLRTLDEKLRSVVSENRAGICFVVGDAGSGKSALIQEFLRARTEKDSDTLVAMGYCNASTGVGDPYLPFKDILSILCGDVGDGAGLGVLNARNAARLNARLGAAVEALLDHGDELVGSLVSGTELLRRLQGQIQEGLAQRLAVQLERIQAHTGLIEQGRIQAQYAKLLRCLAQARPHVLVIEDMQWADIASIQLLFHLFRELGKCRVLLICTYRPIEIALGRNHLPHPIEAVLQEIKRYAGDVWIDLDHIDEGEGRTFVDSLIDAQPNQLGIEFRRSFMAHTGGNALFCTELLHSMQEYGDLKKDDAGAWIESKSVDWNRLPARTEAVIQRHIAGLSDEELQALEIASVEGNVFTAELIARIGQLADRALIKVLSQIEKRHGLVETANVERHGVQWLSRYKFLQTHIQKYLYQSLAPREKMIFHGEVGEFLEAAYAGKAESMALQLAWHFDQAGDAPRATKYLVCAAQNALRLSGYDEADHLLQRAFIQIENMPAGQDRDELELKARILQSTIVKVRKGWASSEVSAIYDRAYRLGCQLDHKREIAPILFGQWACHLVRLELNDASRAALEYQALAKDLNDEDALVQAHYALGNTLFWTGNFAEAGLHLSSSLSDFKAEKAEEHIQRYGQDSRVLSLMMISINALVLGRSDAEESAREMLSLGRRLNHPFSLALALFGMAWVEQQRNRVGHVVRYAEELLELTGKFQFPFYHGGGLLLRGWAMAMSGDVKAGRVELEKGWEEMSADETRLLHSYYCLLGAQVDLLAGDLDRGIGKIRKGLAVVEECNERAFEAELRRVNAELLAAGPEEHSADAMAELEKAADIAAGQNAMLFLEHIRASRNQLMSESRPVSCG